MSDTINTIKIYPTNNIFLNNTFIQDCKDRLEYSNSDTTTNSTSKLVNGRNITIKATSSDTEEINTYITSNTKASNNN